MKLNMFQQRQPGNYTQAPNQVPQQRLNFMSAGAAPTRPNLMQLKMQSMQQRRPQQQIRPQQFGFNPFSMMQQNIYRRNVR